jgi:hypothetical protein
MAITRKKYEERYEELVRWQTKLVRGATEPKSLAEKMYPHLPTSNNSKPVEGKFQGWAHLSRQQKEK